MRERSPVVLILLVSIVVGVVLGIVLVRAAPKAFAFGGATPSPSPLSVDGLPLPHPPAIHTSTTIPFASPAPLAAGGFQSTAPDGDLFVQTLPNNAFYPGTGPTSDSTSLPVTVSAQPKPSKLISALHALGSPQTASDVYPLPSFLTETDIDPSTVHRIQTTADGSTLWIGRTPNTICLLFSSGNPFPTNGISAGASCPTTTQFSESGAVLQEGVDHWTWDGKHFTTTIEH